MHTPKYRVKFLLMDLPLIGFVWVWLPIINGFFMQLPTMQPVIELSFIIVYWGVLVGFMVVAGMVVRIGELSQWKIRLMMGLGGGLIGLFLTNPITIVRLLFELGGWANNPLNQFIQDFPSAIYPFFVIPAISWTLLCIFCYYRYSLNVIKEK